MKRLNTFNVIKFTSLVIILFLCQKTYAQEGDMGYTDYDIDALQPFKISNGSNVVKIGTIFSSYLDLRQYPTGGTPDYTKNTFKLKDARLDIKGKSGENYEYHLKLDFAAWGNTYAADGGPLEDANITYKGLKKLFNIKVGYGKVPYSLNSLVEHYESPYWERPQVSKGDFFSRRDLGITLKRSFWNGRIKAAAGMYSGVGEVVLGGTNDPASGGKFEYIGRVEASYPEDHNEEMIDVNKLTTPNVSIGLNARYSSRSLPTGSAFLDGETGAMLNSSDTALELKVINGKKLVYGGDISVEYMGFSAQFEANLMKGTHSDPNDAHLVGLPENTTGGYFKAGGWYAQANYFSKAIKTIISVRYDEMNANDLITGVSQHFAGALCYQLKGYNSMIKFQMDHGLQFNNDPSKPRYGGEPINTTKWLNEFRLGWQLVID